MCKLIESLFCNDKSELNSKYYAKAGYGSAMAFCKIKKVNKIANDQHKLDMYGSALLAQPI